MLVSCPLCCVMNFKTLQQRHSLALFFIFCSVSVSLARVKGTRAHTQRAMDDDPFDFKLGVDALRAKTESKLATALENVRDDAPGNVVDVEDVRALSSNRQSDESAPKKTNGDASASADDQNEKRKEKNDDAAQATIESFSTETKVILTTLGKMLERLEALELVALRNAKEVARMEHALQGFIVSQTRKENGKEPIMSANLFTVADSEGEEEEEREGEKVEEENKENRSSLREEEASARRRPPLGGAHHPQHPPHPPPPSQMHNQNPYGPPSFARGGRGGRGCSPHPPPPLTERSTSPGESSAYYPGVDHHHRSAPPSRHGGPSAPPPPSTAQHHDPYGIYHPPPPPPPRSGPQSLPNPYPSPPPPSPPQMQNEDIPLDVIVGEFASMGFTRDEVMTVLGKMEARNEQKEMNSILDKLMAGEGKL